MSDEFKLFALLNIKVDENMPPNTAMLLNADPRNPGARWIMSPENRLSIEEAVRLEQIINRYCREYFKRSTRW